MSEPKITHRRPVLREPDLPDLKRGDRLEARAGLLVRQLVREEAEGAPARARARVEGVGEPDPSPMALDPLLRGPDVGTAQQHRSRRLEAVDAVTPGGTVIRRARVRDPLRRMVLSGASPYRLYVAAEKLRDDLEVGEGGVDAGEALARALSRLATDTPPSPSAPWQRSNAARPGQWDAQQRIKRAWQEAIGLVAAGVFSWVVLSRGTLDDYAACKRIRRSVAGATLRGALERLADFYDLGEVQPPPDWEKGLDGRKANGA